MSPSPGVRGSSFPEPCRRPVCLFFLPAPIFLILLLGMHKWHRLLQVAQVGQIKEKKEKKCFPPHSLKSGGGIHSKNPSTVQLARHQKWHLMSTCVSKDTEAFLKHTVEVRVNGKKGGSGGVIPDVFGSLGNAQQDGRIGKTHSIAKIKKFQSSTKTNNR